MLEIDILFNLFIKDCMLISSVAENFKDSNAKFGSNWPYPWA